MQIKKNKYQYYERVIKFATELLCFIVKRITAHYITLARIFNLMLLVKKMH